VSPNWRVEYDTDVIIGKVRGLRIWDVLDYDPKVGEYQVAMWVPEHVYAQEVIRYVLRKAKEHVVAQGGKWPGSTRVYEIATTEYFGLHDGLVVRMTKARLALKGRVGKAPTVRDYEKTIHVLLEHGIPQEDADGG